MDLEYLAGAPVVYRCTSPARWHSLRQRRYLFYRFRSDGLDAQDTLGAHGSDTHLDAHLDAHLSANLGAHLNDNDERDYFDSVKEPRRLYLCRRVPTTT